MESAGAPREKTLAPVGKVSTSQSTWAAINSMGGVIARAVTNRGGSGKKLCDSSFYNTPSHPHGVDRFIRAKTLRICCNIPGKLRFSPESGPKFTAPPVSTAGQFP